LKRVFGFVTEVDQALVNDFRPRFGGNITAQITSGSPVIFR